MNGFPNTDLGSTRSFPARESSNHMPGLWRHIQRPQIVLPLVCHTTRARKRSSSALGQGLVTDGSSGRHSAMRRHSSHGSLFRFARLAGVRCNAHAKNGQMSALGSILQTVHFSKTDQGEAKLQTKQCQSHPDLIQAGRGSCKGCEMRSKKQDLRYELASWAWKTEA